jgi:nucleotide-binding universal stress UspA family protein
MEIDDRIKKEVAEARAAEFADSDRIIEHALTSLRGRFANANGMKKVGDPPVEILDAAAALKADIIAMGSRGLRGISGALGSVSRHVLNHAECSVLIGKT